MFESFFRIQSVVLRFSATKPYFSDTKRYFWRAASLGLLAATNCVSTPAADRTESQQTVNVPSEAAWLWLVNEEGKLPMRCPCAPVDLTGLPGFEEDRFDNNTCIVLESCVPQTALSANVWKNDFNRTLKSYQENYSLLLERNGQKQSQARLTGVIPYFSFFSGEKLTHREKSERSPLVVFHEPFAAPAPQAVRFTVPAEFTQEKLSFLWFKDRSRLMPATLATHPR